MPLFGNFLQDIIDYASTIGGSTKITGGPNRETTIERLPRVEEYVRPVVKTPVSNPPVGTFTQNIGAVGAESPRTRDLIRQYEDKPQFPQELVQPTTQAAQNYGIDPNILASLLASESGGYGYTTPAQVGPAGEVGISQIIPGFHYQSAGYPTVDAYSNALLEREFAINEAARILADLLAQNEGDYFNALSAYNAGQSNLPAGNPYAQATLERIGR